MVLRVTKPEDPTGLTIEAWAQGFMVGALLVMACITIANMRRSVLLHKLILVELLFGMFHGTFIFTERPVYNWYLSSTAILLNTSWSLHNVISWIKNKPFLGRKSSYFYIGTLILVQPYWVLEIVANFLYFSSKSNLFVYTRPYEALFRDPWWLFTVLSLFWSIKTKYSFGYIELIRVSPRFGILLVTMLLSLGFIIVDICSVTHVFSAASLPNGINPFWKLAFIFKCLTDTIVLDDFKTALDRLKEHKHGEIGSGFTGSNSPEDFVDLEQARSKRLEETNPALFRESQRMSARDWSKPDDCEHLDLETALRLGPIDKPSESSGSSGG